ncbi:hypothetical protein ACTA71_000225 [Dictyostelium dimigraforme]
MQSKKKLKIVMLGNWNSGKTAIFNEIAGRRFGSYTCPSTFDLFYREIMIDNEVIGYHWWDTAGQERFTGLNKHYYRDASCCVLCFDIHNEESFQSLDKWINDLHSKCLENGLESEKLFPPFVLLSTKNDITKTDQSISRDRIENWCKNIEDQVTTIIGGKIHYFETSAKSSKNIKESLGVITKLALNYFYSIKELNQSKLNIISQPKSDNELFTC